MSERVLGIIPCRGGSKSIPRKNLALLGGRPLLQHALESARASHRLTRTIVSSDDAEMIAVVQALGGEAPFVRPRELATDTARSVDVVHHALLEVERQESQSFDAVCLLQPSAPLRRGEDIDEALQLLFSGGVDAVVSVCALEDPHPAKLQVIRDGYLRPFLPEVWGEGLRRQDLPPVYFLNGAVYAVRRETIVELRSLWGARTRPYVMPRSRSVVIDVPEDLLVAEVFLHTA